MSLLVPNGCARFKSNTNNDVGDVAVPAVLGQVTKVNITDGKTTITVNPLVPSPVDPTHQQDPRINVVPHLKLLIGQEQSIDMSAFVFEPILVTHVNSYLTNVVTYREGMTDIYAIGWQENQSTTHSLLSTVAESQFPCLWGYPVVLDSQLDFIMVRDMQLNQMILDAPFELYKFRHALASEIQKSLRASRGRRLSISFSFYASLRTVSSLFDIMRS